ncbi:hypothetical protein CALCODRAFT_15494 [Calocera cornea HHB12733]|uniref:Uncharacterized protein n=1 Tax=Calocera cornea HHB12733 TaxID=1353952 RepID=A0A165E8L3_9BASI|nr:hypothetical protein CALCODRAFT_15494 [Calocera cornea HHB12733]
MIWSRGLPVCMPPQTRDKAYTPGAGGTVRVTMYDPETRSPCSVNLGQSDNRTSRQSVNSSTEYQSTAARGALVLYPAAGHWRALESTSTTNPGGISGPSGCSSIPGARLGGSARLVQCRAITTHCTGARHQFVCARRPDKGRTRHQPWRVGLLRRSNGPTGGRHPASRIPRRAVRPVAEQLGR